MTHLVIRSAERKHNFNSYSVRNTTEEDKCGRSFTRTDVN